MKLIPFKRVAIWEFDPEKQKWNLLETGLNPQEAGYRVWEMNEKLPDHERKAGRQYQVFTDFFDPNK